MENLQEKWSKVLELLRPEIPAIGFDTWFADLQAVKTDDALNILYVECDLSFTLDILQRRYIPLLEGCAKAIFKNPYKIEIILKGEQAQSEEAKKADEMAVYNEFSDEYYFNPRYNFENFVVGQNNEYAHAVALAVAEAPSKMYNPLFIYGASGLGKTHLLHAIGHYILSTSKKKTVLYVSSEMFTSELIAAIRDTNKVKLKNFKKKYRDVDVLLIDDIQFIEGKDATQDEFFHTFNHLHDNNKQIIISSDRPPNKLVNLDDRLRSRFAWNIVADIKAPDYETRVAIITKKAQLEHIPINEDLLAVAHLIAEKIKFNVRELEGAFSRIISFSTLLNRPINLALAKETLKDILSSSDSHITVESIKRYVCKYFNITLKDIESPKKTRNLALPRQISMYIARELTDESLPKIGEAFGGRDHTTVLHAHNKISREIINNESINTYVSDIIKIVNEA